MPWEILVIVLALLLVGWLFWTRRPGASSRGAEKWERLVLSQTLGNRGAMERAVTSKRKKFPEASRAQLLEMVHEDYARDRSR